ncbi:hypothetical protein M1413_00030 [Patescibacteria group bacterium]|jgi:hypothetical protein|nr:hypothetical protein [Patescibacteria group bacterium]MCL5114583.1 hypothetical protein [Patescibacteria group bacterium]
MNHVNKKNAQAMIIVSILMGGLFLVGTAIAGLLMFYQLRQAADAASSGAAVMAADAGIEHSLSCYYATTTPATSVLCPPDGSTFSMCQETTALPNGATASSSLSFSCAGGSPTGFWAQSFGYAGGGKAERVLQSFFSIQ